MATRSRIKEVESSNGPPGAEAVPPAKKPEEKGVVIPQPIVSIMHVRIVGDTPLVCHAFPDKEKKRMIQDRLRDETAPHKEAKGSKQGKPPRPARDFDKEFRDSLYPIEGGGNGFPAAAFHRAIVGACRNVEGLSMKDANRWIYVLGEGWSKGFEVVRIEGSPIKREDIVRIGKPPNKVPEIVYRAEFPQWSCRLAIKFFPNKISWPQLVNLIMWAGLTEGIGEMRPSAPNKPFNFGQFHPVNED